MLYLIIKVINTHSKIFIAKKQPDVTKNRKRERMEGVWKERGREKRRKDGGRGKKWKGKGKQKYLVVILSPKVTLSGSF